METAKSERPPVLRAEDDALVDAVVVDDRGETASAGGVDLAATSLIAVAFGRRS